MSVVAPQDRLAGAKDENLAAHLMSAEFFDADNHPEITFTSDDLRINGGDVELVGELTAELEFIRAA